MLQWTLRCIYLFELVFWTFSDKSSAVELLVHMVVLFLIFWGTFVLFSIVAAPICKPTDSAWGFLRAFWIDQGMRYFHHPWKSVTSDQLPDPPTHHEKGRMMASKRSVRCGRGFQSAETAQKVPRNYWKSLCSHSDLKAGQPVWFMGSGKKEKVLAPAQNLRRILRLKNKALNWEQTL